MNLTVDDFKKLPRLAMVAFAARCTRRMQPLCKLVQLNTAQEHIDAVERAIELAEQIANGRRGVIALLFPVKAALEAAEEESRIESVRAYHAYDMYNNSVYGAFGNVVYAAIKAVDTATATYSHAAEAASHAAEAAVTAAEAAEAAYVTRRNASAYGVFGAAMHRDFELLCETARKEGWTDETSVSLDFFGPIWLYGAPEGWI